MYETPFVAWKYSLDFDLTIRLTRGEEDSLEGGKSNLLVIETWQTDFWDIARRDVCLSLYWSFLRFGKKTDTVTANKENDTCHCK